MTRHRDSEPVKNAHGVQSHGKSDPREQAKSWWLVGQAFRPAGQAGRSAPRRFRDTLSGRFVLAAVLVLVLPAFKSQADHIQCIQVVTGRVFRQGQVSFHRQAIIGA